MTCDPNQLPQRDMLCDDDGSSNTPFSPNSTGDTDTGSEYLSPTRKRVRDEAGTPRAPKQRHLDLPLFISTHAGLGGPARGAAFRYKAPSVVHALGGQGTQRWVRRITMKDALTYGTEIDRARLAAGLRLEPDTPVCSKNPQFPNGAQTWMKRGRDSVESAHSSESSEKLAPHCFTHDAVITPASYGQLDPITAPSPQRAEALDTANRVLNLLSSTFDSESNSFKYSTVDTAVLANEALKVIQSATGIMKGSRLLTKVTAQAWVFGDIHGNYRDLSFFLRRLLLFGDISLSPYRLVFLGDYVDRGPHSLECLLVVYCLKMISPTTVHLLRGNHEDAAICGDVDTYGEGSFKMQCEELFGAEEGGRIFEAACKSFEHLPLAATINDRVFCSHSGIPRVWNPKKDGVCYEDRLAPLDMQDAARFYSLFEHGVNHTVEDELQEAKKEKLRRQWLTHYDLLWSDPIKDAAVPLDPHGFGKNDPEDTVVSFSAKAVETFLTNYGFDLMIRANQEKEEGMHVSGSPRVLTISTSGSCTQDVGASVLLVQRNGSVSFIARSTPTREPTRS